jgi:hypothetical protein
VALPEDESAVPEASAPDPARTTNPQTRTAEPGGRPRFNWPFVAVLVALGGTLAYVMVSKMSPPAPHTPVVTAAPVPAPAVPPPSPPPPVAAPAPQARGPVEVTVRGAPKGARILLDGRVLGEAPGPVLVPYGEAAVQLTITAAGHPPGAVTLVPSKPVEVKLKRRAAAAPSLPRDLENPF